MNTNAKIAGLPFDEVVDTVCDVIEADVRIVGWLNAERLNDTSCSITDRIVLTIIKALTATKGETNRAAGRFEVTDSTYEGAIVEAVVVRAARVSDKALTGVAIGSVFSQLDTLFWKEYLNPSASAPAHIQNLTVTQNGTDFAGTFRRLNNGNIRFSFNGNNYTAVIYSDTWIRINNYPANGQSTDLFRVSQRVWKSISGANNGTRIVPVLQFRKTGN